MRLRPLLLLLPVLLLPGLGCGGGSSTSGPASSAPAAQGLAYTDPSGTGWRLLKDASSTDTRLVLKLVGPSGLKTRGVGFNLQAGAGATFGAFASGLPLEELGVYQLRQVGSTDPSEPVACTGGRLKGNVLSVGLYQKDRDQSAQDSGAPLLRIALVLDPAAKVPAGTRVALAVLKAKAIPEDIGSVGDDLWTLDQKMRMTTLSIAVGTLTAR